MTDELKIHYYFIATTLTEKLRKIQSLGGTMAWGSPKGIEDIVERLRKDDRSLTSLYLMRQRRFNEDDALLLSMALSQNSTLAELHLSSHTISPSVAKIVASGLQRNKGIKYISIGNSKFGDDAMAEICRCLPENETIQTLDVEHKGITQQSASSLCSAIQQSKSLKHVRISNNELNDGLVDFAPCITGLESLEIHNCGLHHLTASEAMATALEGARCLRMLELDRNCLGYSNAEILSRGLKGCTALETLSLNGNPLGPQGVQTIATALPESLRRIDLGSTQASSDGINGIVGALSQRRLPNLEYLNICGCQADALAVSGVMDAAYQARIPLHLDVGGNIMGEENLENLFESLIRCRNLESLRLHGCNLGSLGTRTLLQCLQDTKTSGNIENHSLRDLDVSGNEIDEKAMVELLQNLPGIVSTVFTNMSSLIIAANPDVEGQAVADLVEKLASDEATKRVVIIRAACDSNQG